MAGTRAQVPPAGLANPLPPPPEVQPRPSAARCAVEGQSCPGSGCAATAHPAPWGGWPLSRQALALARDLAGAGDPVDRVVRVFVAVVVAIGAVGAPLVTGSAADPDLHQPCRAGAVGRPQPGAMPADRAARIAVVAERALLL